MSKTVTDITATCLHHNHMPSMASLRAYLKEIGHFVHLCFVLFRQPMRCAVSVQCKYMYLRRRSQCNVFPWSLDCIVIIPVCHDEARITYTLQLQQCKHSSFKLWWSYYKQVSWYRTNMSRTLHPSELLFGYRWMYVAFWPFKSFKGHEILHKSKAHIWHSIRD